MEVEIVKCSSPDYWYAGRVGQKFEVDPVIDGERGVQVLHSLAITGYQLAFISAEDCQFI